VSAKEPDHHFLAACLRRPAPFTPVWLMRQAGRYMKEYRALRERFSFLELCKTPDLATQITLMPVDQLAVDAAIVFADILLPLEGMGIDLEFPETGGPAIHTQIRGEGDIQNLRIIDPEADVPFVLHAIRQVRRELKGRVPLIGFSGAPFTLASYLLEGGHSKNFVRTKTLMIQNPGAWRELLEKLTSVVIRYLKAQIEAGAQAIQLFDTWAGCLAPGDYEAFVFPYSRRVFETLGNQVPLIHFATNATALLPLIKRAGGDVIGVDWRIALGEAWKMVGYDVGIQGNLDPVMLFASPRRIREAVGAILAAAEHRPGHIFNLGHGVLPGTPVDHVRVMVDAVHEMSQR
jgi:uroporphyrinogen decarboxylase